MNFKEWIETTITEEIATYGQIEDKNALYQSYFQTYADAGLKPWSQSEYEWRAEKWTFVGILPKLGVSPDRVGFVTARNKNGVYKLTGMQGPNTKGKILGLMELARTGSPIWGAMDKSFTDKLSKLDFSNPPLKVMKILLPIIQKDPQFSSGGDWGELTDDGGMKFDLQGVGNTIKYFTANKKFYQMFLQKMISSGKLNPKLLELLKKWNSIPKMMKGMALSAAKPFLPPGIDLDAQSVDWLASMVGSSQQEKSIEKIEEPVES